MCIYISIIRYPQQAVKMVSADSQEANVITSVAHAVLQFANQQYDRPLDNTYLQEL